MTTTRTVREVMTIGPLCLPVDTPLTEAARAMRDNDIGDIVVKDSQGIRGIVTDRDIVIRAVAFDRDAWTTTVGDVCTRHLVTLSADDEIEEAVELMRSEGVRRLIVEDDGEAVGIVSLGDLARDQGARSALGEMSARPPNK